MGEANVTHEYQYAARTSICFSFCAVFKLSKQKTNHLESKTVDIWTIKETEEIYAYRIQFIITVLLEAFFWQGFTAFSYLWSVFELIKILLLFSRH